MARTTRHLLALVGVACLLTACTTPERTSSTPSASPATSVVAPTPSETAAPPLEVDPPRVASELPGTLLVRADDGGMTALRPDATHPVTVVDVADGAMVQQARVVAGRPVDRVVGARGGGRAAPRRTWWSQRPTGRVAASR